MSIENNKETKEIPVENNLKTPEENRNLQTEKENGGDKQKNKPDTIVKKEDLPEELLEELIYKDELTKIYNRRFYNKKFRELGKEALDNKTPISFIMIDVDHFKGFNDVYGHETGDVVLEKVAAAIKLCLGEEGLPIRYAGDEFCSILPGISKQRTVELAEHLRKSVGDLKIETEFSEEPLSITLSVGVSNYPEDMDDPSELQALGDRAAYISKKKGRNKVSTLDEEEQETLDAATLYRYFPCKELTGRDELISEFTPYIAPGLHKMRPIVVLRGLPGIGKSRILEEIHEHTDKQRCFVFRSLATKYNMGQPFVELLDPIMEILDGNPEITSKASAKLDDEMLQAVILFLPELARYRELPKKKAKVSPRQQKESLMKGISEVILTIVEEKPIIMIIDEFQYANMGTRELISHIKKDRRSANFAVFCAACDGEIAKINDPGLLEFINENEKNGILINRKLEPLTSNQTIEMMNKIIKGISKSSSITKSVISYAEGYPGRVEDLLKKLIFEEKIKIEQGKLEIEEVSDEEIMELTKTRFAGTGILENEVLSLLSKAAVVGNPISMEVLKNLDERSESELYELLEKAEKADLLRHNLKGDQVVYEFRDNQVKDQYYNKLSDEERRDLHTMVAQAEEVLNSENVEKVLSKLAFHFDKSAQPDRAMDYMTQLAQNYKGMFSDNSVQLFIGKLPFLDPWGEEKKPSLEEIEKAIRVCKRLKIVLNNLDRYPLQSEIVQGSLDSTYLELKSLLELVEILSYSDAEGTLLINNERPSQEDMEPEVEKEFLSILVEANLRGIAFRKGFTREEFVVFLKIILGTTQNQLEKEGGWDAILKKNKILNAQVNQRIFVTMSTKDLVDAQKIKERRFKVKDTIIATDSSMMQVQGSAGQPVSQGLQPPVSVEFSQQFNDLRDKYVNDEGLMEFLDKLQNIMQMIESNKGALTSGGDVSPSTIPAPHTPSAPTISSAPQPQVPPGVISDTVIAGDQVKQSLRHMAERSHHQELMIVEKVKEETDVLIHELDYDDFQVVKIAGTALLSKGEEVAGPLFEYMLNTESVLGRKTALTILNRVDSRLDKKLLEALMTNTTAFQKESILKILKSMNRIPPAEVFRILIRDSNDRVRRAVLSSIERSPASGHIDILIECLKDENEDVVEDAAYSLGRIGRQEVVPDMVELIKKKLIIFNDGRFKAQEAICKALGQLGGGQALMALANVLTVNPPLIHRNKPPSVRAAAAFALGYFPPAEANELLEKASKDSSPIVRSAVNLARKMIEGEFEDEFQKVADNAAAERKTETEEKNEEPNENNDAS